MSPLRETAGGRPARGSSAAAPELERLLINISWLLKLRWAAVAGQVVTVLVVRLVLGVELPLGVLGALICVTVATNAAASVWVHPRRIERLGRRGELVVALVMAVDLVTLTALLMATGGPSNPFGVFYTVNLALAAVVLRSRWAWFLCALTVGGYTLLFYVHRPLAPLGDLGDVRPFSYVSDGAGDDPRALQLQGMLVSITVASLIVVYFITRLKGELARKEAELAEARRGEAHAEKLEALATLSAGAAHELASPLSTIAVIARELEVALSSGADLADALEDARLVRAEVARCREILDQMATRAGQSAGEEMVFLTASEIAEGALDGLPDPDRVVLSFATAARERVLWGPREGLTRALRNLILNGIEASDPASAVRVEVGGDDGGSVRFRVADEGSGMESGVLERAGDPFFTTKEPGAGMGLGIFLARSIVERLGGSLEISSRSGAGTEATIDLPAASETSVRRPAGQGPKRGSGPLPEVAS